jgi:hypothetical protein
MHKQRAINIGRLSNRRPIIAIDPPGLTPPFETFVQLFGNLHQDLVDRLNGAKNKARASKRLPALELLRKVASNKTITHPEPFLTWQR